MWTPRSFASTLETGPQVDNILKSQVSITRLPGLNSQQHCHRYFSQQMAAELPAFPAISSTPPVKAKWPEATWAG